MTPETLAFALLRKQLPFIEQRWAHDLELQVKLDDFIERSEGDFRQQVLDLLQGPVDRGSSSMMLGGKARRTPGEKLSRKAQPLMAY